ncbi:MAG: hypothetical protein LBS19_03030 [Clostridiales bacterium]|jgi:hypothetical protein|nr:hypothetical protein [Clostridiales bacterium]
MKKKIIAMVGAVVLCLSMATSAFAATAPAGYGYGCGMYGAGYSLMWDEDGNFLDQESFEANLDKLIEDGVISEYDRDYYLERYEWCSTNGGGAAGTRGGGCGMGRGRGCGRGW